MLIDSWRVFGGVLVVRDCLPRPSAVVRRASEDDARPAAGSYSFLAEPYASGGVPEWRRQVLCRKHLGTPTRPPDVEPAIESALGGLTF